MASWRSRSLAVVCEWRAPDAQPGALVVAVERGTGNPGSLRRRVVDALQAGDRRIACGVARVDRTAPEALAVGRVLAAAASPAACRPTAGAAPYLIHKAVAVVAPHHVLVGLLFTFAVPDALARARRLANLEVASAAAARADRARHSWCFRESRLAAASVAAELSRVTRLSEGFLGLSGAVVKKKRTAQRAQGLMRSERALRATPAALCDAQASNQARCSLGTGFAPLPQSRWSRPSQRRRRIFEGSDPSTCQIATKPALSKQSAAPSANRCSASNIGHRTS